MVGTIWTSIGCRLDVQRIPFERAADTVWTCGGYRMCHGFGDADFWHDLEDLC